jgi:glycosyltransferase involved in cell wall biosynthesis
VNGAGSPPDPDRPRERIATVGMSIDDPCGVHDHAVGLARALDADGFSSTWHWLRRGGPTFRRANSELRSWTRELGRELALERPDAVLLHYSVFAHSHRGVPVLVAPLLSALRRSHVPIVTFMHEYAYPWHLGGLRGKAWASTQRVALIALMSACAEAVVSADARARWLRSRAWLPRREISVAPVFSNLPPASEQVQAGAGDRIGLFGYAHEGVALEIVVGALADLRRRGQAAELVLLGAPGEASPAGARWQRAARREGLDGVLSFSGRLNAQDLSNELARCAVLLFAERGGPTSRKTTLAASLASGRPVVVLDGQNSWAQLLSSQAAVLAQPSARSLADAVAALLGDRRTSERQGERGRQFAAAAMSVEHSAQIVGAALARSLDRARR